MSSDEQAESPEQQKESVLKLAKQEGYRIVHWYEDLAISGDATAKRKGFKQMIADAGKRQFQAILCWDQDRFGRFDPMEANYYWFQLREAGVRIVTVGQGELDFSDLGGWLTASVAQHGKNQFLKDLSRNVLRGQFAKREAGAFIRRVPPGLCRIYYDERGQEMRRVGYQEKFRLPEGWTVKFGATSKTAEADAICWAFETYATTDVGIGAIARGLQDRGVVDSKQNRISNTAVGKMLRNTKYIGLIEVGKNSKGRYHRLNGDGTILAVEPEMKNGVGDPLVLDNLHVGEPLISRKVFEKVQKKIASRASHRKRTQASPYILTGTLRCNHCNRPMAGSRNTSGKKTRAYRCRGWETGECQGHTVGAEKLEQHVIGFIQDAILGDDAVERIRSEISRQVADRTGTKSDVARFRVRLEALEKQIANVRKKWAVADGEDADALHGILEDLKDQRSRVREAFDSASGILEAPSDVEERAIGKVLRMREEFASGDPLKMRAIIGEVFESISLTFEQRGRVRRLVKGEMRLNDANLTTCS